MTATTTDPVATAEALDELLAMVADDTGVQALGEDARQMLHTVIVALETALREREQTRAQLAGLTEQWAFQYTSYGVTETSLVCESREEAERESGQHRRGDRIVRRLCGEWEPVDGSADGAS